MAGQSFQTPHRILQNTQVGRYTFELNVDDALLPEGQQSRRELFFKIQGKLLEPRLAQPLDSRSQLINSLCDAVVALAISSTVWRFRSFNFSDADTLSKVSADDHVEVFLQR